MSRLATLFLKTFIPLAGVLGVIYGGYEYLNFKIRMVEAQSLEVTHVSLGKSSLEHDLSFLSSDIAILATSEALGQFLQTPTQASHNKLQQLFVTYVRNRQFYDQVRYLDETGQEIVRVNLLERKPVVVRGEDLQDKSGRYYFEEALALDPGQTYVSPLDLNIENGQVEIPHKPMLRLAQPVFDASGNKRGVLILNYLAKHMLDRYLAAMPKDLSDNHLVNRDGAWLQSSSGTHDWGFMFGAKASFANTHPEIWQRIQDQDRGHFTVDHGFVAFTTLYPAAIVEQARAHPSDNERFWKIIAILPTERFDFGSFIMDRPLDMGVIAFFLIMATAGSFSIARSRLHEEQANTRMAEAVQNAQLANQAKSEFLANMSHELRTPLNSIIGFSEMMEYEVKGPMPGTYHEYAGLITNSGRLLLETVNSILDLAKIEAGKFELQRENAYLGDVLHEVTSLLNVQAKAGHIDLVNAAEDLHHLYIDPIRIKQVLMNIIGNAIKFTEQGCITVTSKCTKKGHDIIVSDTGIGMSQEQIKLALMPFRQVHGHAFARRYQGTGLGLSLSHQIMKLHGGRLDITSTPGVGTRVTLHFPCDACDTCRK